MRQLGYPFSPVQYENAIDGHFTGDFQRYKHGSSTNTKSSYFPYIHRTPFDFYSLGIRLYEIGANNTATGQLFDIAIGEPGSEQIIIPNLDGGNAGGTINAHNLGINYWFPYFIPKGSRIAIRGQALIASDTADIQLFGLHEPQFNPQPISPWIAYGADTTNSRGTSVTTGNGADGTWTSIGTTSQNHQLYIPALDMLADVTQAAQAHYYMQIGFGPNSGAVTILGTFHSAFGLAETQCGGCIPWFCSGASTAGTQLWARVAMNAAEARGVIIYAY